MVISQICEGMATCVVLPEYKHEIGGSLDTMKDQSNLLTKEKENKEVEEKMETYQRIIVKEAIKEIKQK